ncbi:hypothetical protein K439DRAFT_960025 [Ramaria rubella]|nr:hypothetical protein K439DRAFT_960025 [Ramaria rubella]
MYLISQDKTLWATLAIRLSKSLPLPSKAQLENFSLFELEWTVIRGVQVEREWLRPRKAAPRKFAALRPPGQDPVIYLKLFENRFALTVYSESLTVILWDVDGLTLLQSAEKDSWGRIVGRWIYEDGGEIVAQTCYARYLETSKEIIVTFCILANSVLVLEVLSISVDGNPAQQRPFRRIGGITHPPSESLQIPPCVIVKGDWVVKGRYEPHGIEITNLNTGTSTILTAIKKPGWNDTLDHPEFDSWLAIEICGPYVIAVRLRFIQVYLIPADIEGQGHGRSMVTHVETFFLPNDQHFQTASVSVPVSDSSSSLSVVIILSDTFHLVSQYVIRLPREPNLIFTLTLTLAGIEASLRERNVFIGSEIALGRQGMRAAWIEKNIHDMERHIVVLKTTGGDPSNVTKQGSLCISRIFCTSSSSLWDDLVHVSLDEVSGRIVVATRGGVLWDLSCWQRILDKGQSLTTFKCHNLV